MKTQSRNGLSLFHIYNVLYKEIDMIDIKDADNALGLCNEFIELIRKKFSNVNIEFSVNSYHDKKLDTRVYILSDQYDEILRVSFKNGIIYLFRLSLEKLLRIYTI